MKTFVLALVVAACGGSSKPAPAPPTDPVATSEPAADPAAPAEPSAPATPAEAPAAPATPPAAPPPPPAPDPETTKTALLAAETAAFEKAKPVFDKFCAKCHVKGAKAATAKKLEHFDMTTYPFGGEHAMEMGEEIREVLAIGGGRPTMPFDKKGAVKGADLALIAAWADAFDASHKAGAHQGHDGHKH